MASNPSYVVVKGSGGAGLGDRICGLAVGILYAKHTGRMLAVDWRDRAFGTQQRNLFPDLLRVEGIPVAELPDGAVEVAPEIWAGRLDCSIDQLRAFDLDQRGVRWTGAAPPWDRDDAIRRYSIDVTEFDYPQQAVVVWSGGSMNSLTAACQQRGWIEPRRTAEATFGCVVRKHVRLHRDIECRARRFREVAIGDRAVLGVHYRKTNEAAAARTLPTEAQYLKATDATLARLPPGAVIFLATDNREVQQRYIQRYGKHRVDWSDKWLPESGASIHKNSDCPDGVAAARDALVDVALLASCDRLVLTGNSSFSSLANWFSPASNANPVLLFPQGHSTTRRVFHKVKGLIGTAVAKERRQ